METDGGDRGQGARDGDDFLTPERRARVRASLEARVGSVVAVAECVHRRHNMSAILRSCESFGVHEVHLIAEGFTPSPGAARGAERWVRCRNFQSVEASLDELEARGFRIYAADFAEPRWSPEEVPLDRPVAVVFGTEAAGVSARARARAAGSITIPMHGLTASLNVSVSAAIILRALADRRRAIAGPDLDPAERERFYREWVEQEQLSRRGFVNRTSL